MLSYHVSDFNSNQNVYTRACLTALGLTMLRRNMHCPGILKIVFLVHTIV